MALLIDFALTEKQNAKFRVCFRVQYMNNFPRTFVKS